MELNTTHDVKEELFYGMCQCCLAENELKSMVQTFHNDGRVEVYAEMLKQCFSIEVQSDNTKIESLHLICDACIIKLRDSYLFRLQIEKCQSWLQGEHTRKKSNKFDSFPVIEDISIKLEWSSDSNDNKEVFSPMVIKKKRKRGIKAASKIQSKIVRRNIHKKILDAIPKDIVKKMSKEEYIKVYNKYYHLDLVPFKISKSERVCHVCNESFQFHKALVDHMRIHFPNFICDLCGKSFVTKKCMERHVLRHNNTQVRCEICNKYLKKSSLLNHIRRHSGNSAINKCTVCPEYFVNYYKRQDHMQEVHGIERPRYPCSFCTKTFAHSSALSKHKRTFHWMEKKFICEECGKSFYSETCLENHIISHSQDNFES